jgi:thiol-disulfide isomerase/thioredoxin
MSKKILIAALLLAAAAGGFLLRSEMQKNNLALSNSADVSVERMAFTLPDLEGTPRDFAEWDGKARIVNFWATWCAPCRREIPLLKATQDKHAADDLQIIGIAVDFTEDVIAYAAEAKFNYPILVGQEDAMAIAESSGVPFIGLPFTLVVTPDGQLLAAHMGEIHAPQIDTIVAELAAIRDGSRTIAEARETLKKL